MFRKQTCSCQGVMGGVGNNSFIHLKCIYGQAVGGGGGRIKIS